MLPNWTCKALSIALFGSLLVNSLQKINNNDLRNDNIMCVESKAKQLEAMNFANQQKEALEVKLHHTEKEAADVRAEGQKHKDFILKTPLSNDCNKVRLYLIEQVKSYR